MNYKALISIVAVVLTFAGYLPYITDTIKKKTKPHCFTWFIASLAGFIQYFLQVLGGAGVGSWSLLAASIICLLIFILSLRIGNKDITFLDVIFLILSLVSLVLWFFAKEPVLSLVLINAVEILGFFPTIRKSWNKPYTETLFLYELSIVRHGISIFSLERLNILTLLTPTLWAITNIFITTILIIRRRKIKPEVS